MNKDSLRAYLCRFFSFLNGKASYSNHKINAESMAMDYVRFICATSKCSSKYSENGVDCFFKQSVLSTPTRYPNRSSINLGRTMGAFVEDVTEEMKSLNSQENRRDRTFEENAEEQNNSDNNTKNRVPSGDISSGEESVYDEDEEQIQHVLDDDDKDKEISKLKKENEDLKKRSKTSRKTQTPRGTI